MTRLLDRFVLALTALLLIAGGDSCKGPGGSGGGGGSGQGGGYYGLPDAGTLQYSTAPYADEVPPTPIAIPGQAGALADQLAGATDYTSAVSVVRDVLYEAGVPVTNIGGLVRDGKAPTTWSVAYETDVLNYALHAYQPGLGATTTLGELGRQLGTLGWPTGTAPERTFGTFFADWTTQALASPDDPASFAPLFVAAMAQKRSPSLNVIESAPTRPGEVVLSPLEVAVLLAAFDRIVPQDPVRLRDLNPCTAVAKNFGALGEAGANLAPLGTSKLVEHAFKAIGDTEGATPEILGVVGTMQKIEKLAILYQSSRIKVEPLDGTTTHKALKSEGPKQVHFRATVGMSVSDLAQYTDQMNHLDPATKAALNGCLSTWSLPALPQTAADAVADVANWRVAWGITEGGLTEGHWAPGSSWDIVGRFENKVTVASGDTQGTNDVAVELVPEIALTHDGPKKTGPLTVRAELKTSQAPDMMTFISAGQGVMGLTDAFIDLGSGLFQELVTKKAYATMIIDEHVVSGWSGVIRLSELSAPYHHRFTTTDGTGDYSDTTLSTVAGTIILVAGGPDKNPFAGYLHTVFGTRCQVRANVNGRSTDLGEGGYCAGPDGGNVPCVVTTSSNNLTWVSGSELTGGLDQSTFLDLPSVTVQAVPHDTGHGFAYDNYTLAVLALQNLCGDTPAYVVSQQKKLLITPATVSTGTVQYLPYSGATLAATGPYEDYRNGHLTGELEASYQTEVVVPFLTETLDMRYYLEWDLEHRE